MLAIPFKKTSPSIDIAGPLRRYIGKEFSEEEAKKYEGDFTTMQQLRAKAVSVEMASSAGRDALGAYAGALAGLETVFPVSETEVKVNFKWVDAFNGSKSSSHSSLLFERTCVVYNLAAMESRFAAEADRTTEAGLKEACHRFQQAAGVFNYVHDRLSPGLVGTLTQDLISDGLHAASVLMLAQAQACFYEKAVKDRAKTKIKPKIIAKLAAKSGEFYLQVLGFMTGPNLAPGLDRSWAGHVEFQAFAFEAASNYWEGVAIHEEAEQTGIGYGVEIGRLNKALGILDKALKIASRHGLSQAFTSSAEGLRTTITKSRTCAIADNTSVYLEPIPEPVVLSAIAGAAIVKVAEFVHPVYSSSGSSGGNKGPEGGVGGGGLFAGLLSKSAKAAVEKYRERESALIKGLEKEATETSAKARSGLASVGLPGTLEAHECQGGVPESVWVKVSTLKESTRGLTSLRDKVSEVEELAERADGTLTGVEKTLQQDENRDNDFRRRYNGEYEGVSTHDLSTDLQKDLEHYRGLWQAARESDVKIMGRLEEPTNRDTLSMLDLSREELDARMPSGVGAGALGQGESLDTSALSGKLVELATLLTERSGMMTALEEAAKSSNPEMELLKDSSFQSSPGGGGVGGGSVHEEAMAALLASFEPRKVDLEANFAKQAPLMEHILAENERFQKARASDPATLAREAFLQRVHSMVTLYHEVHAQLSEGASFYADLLRRLGQLNQTCEDLVYTQGLSRREFEVGYTHQKERELKEGQDAELARKLMEEAKVEDAAAAAARNSPQHPQVHQPQQGPIPVGGDGLPTGYHPGGSGGGGMTGPGIGGGAVGVGAGQPQQPVVQGGYPGGQYPYQQAQPTQQSQYWYGQQNPQANQSPQQAPGQPYGTYAPPQPTVLYPSQPSGPSVVHGGWAGHTPARVPSTAQGSLYTPQQQGGYGAPAYTPHPAYQGHNASPPPSVTYGGGQLPPQQGGGGYGGGYQGGPGPVTSAPGGYHDAPPTYHTSAGTEAGTGAGGGAGSGASGASPGVGPGGPHAEKLKRLVEMGFDRERTRKALEDTNGDERAAVGILLSQA